MEARVTPEQEGESIRWFDRRWSGFQGKLCQRDKASKEAVQRVTAPRVVG